MPTEVFASGELEDATIVARRADIRRVSDVSDAAVRGSEAAGNLLRSVRGRIVADDQLEVAERLLEERTDCGGEVSLPVKYGNPDADWRMRRVHTHLVLVMIRRPSVLRPEEGQPCGYRTLRRSAPRRQSRLLAAA